MFRYGDKITEFYHMHVNQRRKTNKISQVIDPDGYLVIDPVGDMFSNYYSQLFASSNLLEVNLCV